VNIELQGYLEYEFLLLILMILLLFFILYNWMQSVGTQAKESNHG
jgi:hypothetical protein